VHAASVTDAAVLCEPRRGVKGTNRTRALLRHGGADESGGGASTRDLLGIRRDADPEPRQVEDVATEAARRPTRGRVRAGGGGPDAGASLEVAKVVCLWSPQCSSGWCGHRSSRTRRAGAAPRWPAITARGPRQGRSRPWRSRGGPSHGACRDEFEGTGSTDEAGARLCDGRRWSDGGARPTFAALQSGRQGEPIRS